jgi:hypothetical protein
VAVGLAGVGGVGKALDTAEEYSSYAERAKQLVEPVTAIIQDNVWLILAGLGAIVIYQTLKQKRLAAEKYRAGETIKA